MEVRAVALKTAVYSDIKVRNKPSFYAPPVAWAAADFVESLIRDNGGILPLHTGIVAVSDECSLDTIRALSQTVDRGTVSPLRFAGASPSIMAGLPALRQGIRGPTLCLTMPPHHAPGTILAIVDHWIKYAGIVSVVVLAHCRQDGNRHVFRGLIASAAADDEVAHEIMKLGEFSSS